MERQVPYDSAGLKLVRDVSWPVADLRCDWTEDCPIEQLARLWDIYKPQLDAYVTRAINPSTHRATAWREIGRNGPRASSALMSGLEARGPFVTRLSVACRPCHRPSPCRPPWPAQLGP